MLFVFACVLGVLFVFGIGVGLCMRCCIQLVFPVLNFIVMFSHYLSLLSLIGLIAAIVFSYLSNFEEPNLLMIIPESEEGPESIGIGIFVIIPAALTGFFTLIVIAGKFMKRLGWFKHFSDGDEDLEQLQREMAAAALRPQRKPLWKRCYHCITRKTAYSDMVTRIHKNATEQVIDKVIAWVPQPVHVEEAVPMTKEGENETKGRSLGKG
jgi:hypothetical protein